MAATQNKNRPHLFVSVLLQRAHCIDNNSNNNRIKRHTYAMYAYMLWHSIFRMTCVCMCVSFCSEIIRAYSVCRDFYMLQTQKTLCVCAPFIRSNRHILIYIFNHHFSCHTLHCVRSRFPILHCIFGIFWDWKRVCTHTHTNTNAHTHTREHILCVTNLSNIISNDLLFYFVVIQTRMLVVQLFMFFIVRNEVFFRFF